MRASESEERNLSRCSAPMRYTQITQPMPENDKNPINCALSNVDEGEDTKSRVLWSG